MTTWLNRAAFLMPRNGTTSHTITPSSATNLASGTAFSPAAGNFLVAILWGPSTNPTPSGWTSQVVGDNAGNGTLRLITRTAVGSDTFTVTHADSNMPMLAEIFEFSSISSYGSSATKTDYNTSSTMPTLTPGTHTLLVALQCNDFPQGYSYSNCTWSTGTGPAPIEMLDTFIDNGSGISTGLWYSSAYAEDTAASAWAPNVTNDSTRDNRNDLVFSINTSAPASKGTFLMMGIGT